MLNLENAIDELMFSLQRLIAKQENTTIVFKLNLFMKFLLHYMMMEIEKQRSSKKILSIICVNRT